MATISSAVARTVMEVPLYCLADEERRREKGQGKEGYIDFWERRSDHTLKVT